MKKQEQKEINDYILDFIDIYNEKVEDFFNAKRLNYCKAWVFETDNYYVLQSYNTIVAVINKKNGHGFDILRYIYGYTATSAQHISKFFHQYGATKIYTYRSVDRWKWRN